MSIYLAWSVYKLVGTLVVWALLMGALAYGYSKFKTHGRAIVFVGVLSFVAICMGAVNVGDRQKELDRQRFDATVPLVQQQERIESKRRTVESVKDTFEKAVKTTRP